MEKKLELHQLAAYLPYGLKVKLLREEYEGVYNEFSFRPYLDYPLGIKINNDIIYAAMLTEIKPIVYPFDYLTKEITHNGETFVPTERISEYYGYDITIGEPINMMPYIVVQQLLEWKLDVFNLIEKKLAIDVTNEFNPYK